MGKDRRTPTVEEARVARLRQALKDNMAKRKAQARAREAAGQAENAAPGMSGEGDIERDG